MAELFTVYDVDEDDEGCIRLYVNTDIIFDSETADRVASLIDTLDDDGLLADLPYKDKEERA